MAGFTIWFTGSEPEMSPISEIVKKELLGRGREVEAFSEDEKTALAIDTPVGMPAREFARGRDAGTIEVVNASAKRGEAPIELTVDSVREGPEAGAAKVVKRLEELGFIEAAEGEDDVYSEEEKAELAKRLADLGYM